MACLAVKPIVDGLESEFSGQLTVIRLNIQDPAGRSLAAEYGAYFTPTFVFFNAHGTEQWRSVGKLDPEQVRQSLDPSGS